MDLPVDAVLRFTSLNAISANNPPEIKSGMLLPQFKVVIWIKDTFCTSPTKHLKHENEQQQKNRYIKL